MPRIRSTHRTSLAARVTSRSPGAERAERSEANEAFRIVNPKPGSRHVSERGSTTCTISATKRHDRPHSCKSCNKRSEKTLPCLTQTGESSSERLKNPISPYFSNLCHSILSRVGRTDEERMDGRTDGRTTGRTDGRSMDGQTDGPANDGRRMDGRKDGRTDNGTNGRWTDGRTGERWTDGRWTDGRTDGRWTDGRTGERWTDGRWTDGRTDGRWTDSQDVIDNHGVKCDGAVSEILDHTRAFIKF